MGTSAARHQAYHRTVVRHAAVLLLHTLSMDFVQSRPELIARSSCHTLEPIICSNMSKYYSMTEDGTDSYLVVTHPTTGAKVVGFDTTKRR